MLLKFVFRIVSKLFNNALGQKILETAAKGVLRLLGIGNGAGVNMSGELSAVRGVLNQNQNGQYVIFDVGANKGQFREMANSCLKEQISEKNFSIYSFEPSKFTYSILENNFRNLQSPFLNNFGLGSSNKKSVLFYDEIGSGLASQSKRDLEFLNIELGIKEEIEIRTLDSFCEDHNISTINLLKIDVEGYEMDVLAGAEKMIKAGNIKSVMFEFGGCNIDTRTYLKDFYNYFAKNGYRVYRITPGGYLSHLEKYKETYEQFTTTNFLAKIQ